MKKVIFGLFVLFVSSCSKPSFTECGCEVVAKGKIGIVAPEYSLVLKCSGVDKKHVVNKAEYDRVMLGTPYVTQKCINN